MENTNNIFEEAESDNINYLKYLYTALSYWYLFAFCIIIGFCIAFLVNRYSNKEYKSTAKIILQSTEKEMYETAVLDENMGMFSPKVNYEAELEVLKSIPMVLKTIENIDFEIIYIKKGNIKDAELHSNAPFFVIPDTAFPQPINATFTLKYLNEEQFHLHIDDNYVPYFHYGNKTNKKLAHVATFDTIAFFGDSIITPYFKIKIIHKPEEINFSYYTGEIYYFKFADYTTLAYNARNKLTLNRLSNNSNIINLSYSSNHPQKNVDFLNELIKSYAINDLEKKNRISKKTMDFIDNQLLVINDSLENTGSRLQNFRSKNKIIDLSTKAQEINLKLIDTETQRAQLQLKKQYYVQLKNYLKNNTDPKEIISPSSVGIDAPEITGLIAQLTLKTSEKSALSNSDKLNNPYIQKLNREIQHIYNNLNENLDFLIKSSDNLDSQLKNKQKEIEKLISDLPQTERELFGIERVFKINDAIYTYLLQKRSEAQIALASNLPDMEVVEYATLNDTIQTKPNKKMNYTIFLLLGFALPLAFVIIKIQLDQKIYSKQDIEKITKHPVIGTIPHSTKDSVKVIADYPKSSIAEAFRSLRTNLQFFTKNQNSQIILLTSSFSGEGKSYNALNLAYAYALFGKKTLLMGFDLRKPKLHNQLGLINEHGLSTYLSNQSTLEEIIQNSGHQNLDVIVGGPIPPNPVELIASDKNKELITHLSQKYEYIIIDTPPVGIVTDAFLIMDLANTTLFVTRQEYTLKPILRAVLEEMDKNKIQNISILINDVSPEKSYGYGYGYKYGYGYGYKYGYGYYDDVEKNKLSIKYIFKKIRKFV